jgi:hypothetical protein
MNEECDSMEYREMNTGPWYGNPQEEQGIDGGII